jgi:hypothetical protein
LENAPQESVVSKDKPQRAPIDPICAAGPMIAEKPSVVPNGGYRVTVADQP